MNGKLRYIVALVLALGTLSAGVAVAAGGGSTAQAGSEPGCAPHGNGLPQGSDSVSLDPDNFVSRIDNPYFPLTSGSKWIYREIDAQGNVQRVDVKVTQRRKMILGIAATVVRDTVTDDGKVVEDTFDWYAQDKQGNVWYLGEDTKEYDNGKVVSTAGSWEHGVDGAQAGIIMPGDSEVGLTYRQEYYAGEAEDAARILSLDEQADVPYGSFRDVLMTKDYSPLHPELLEHKFFAKGIGPVLTLDVAGASGRMELVRFVDG